ncbi:MAG: peptide chain release factor N(5)-glutamine methyltransferase [Candidatus Uhrbacteria bacterium]
MTTVEALKWANEKLKSDGSEAADSPMLDAQILLAAILKVSTSWLFTHFDQDLKENQLEEFRQFVKRRINKEPVAYIIGEKEFFKRPFLVNPLVLIPRPATEILVETALEKIDQTLGETWFADIGTGSGAIAITLAAETSFPVIASDISPSALSVAKKNADKNKVEELIDFRQGDLLEPLINAFRALQEIPEKNSCQQLIICANLPYLTPNQWQNTDRDVKDFEPKLALVAGQDGLDLYWKLIRDLKKYRSLFPKFLSLLLEIDPDQTKKITKMVQHDFPESVIEIRKDLEGWERVVMVEI